MNLNDLKTTLPTNTSDLSGIDPETQKLLKKFEEVIEHDGAIRLLETIIEDAREQDEKEIPVVDLALLAVILVASREEIAKELEKLIPA